ncbi:MAG: AraC family transcriptional regulator [Spirochaetota bacterium]
MQRITSCTFQGLGLQKLLRVHRFVSAAAYSPFNDKIYRNFINITAVVRGTKHYMVADRAINLRGGEATVIPPGKQLSTGGQIDGKGIHIMMGIYPPGVHRMCADAAVLLKGLDYDSLSHISDGRVIVGIIERVFAIHSSKSPVVIKKVLVVNAVREMLAHLAELSTCAPIMNSSNELGSALDYIQANIGKKTTARELADELNVSPQTLHRKFMHAFGMPPNEYILRIKIEKAKKMLAQRSVSILSCAYRLGFSSAQYFATVFKRYTMQSPKAYRRNG